MAVSIILLIFALQSQVATYNTMYSGRVFESKKFKYNGKEFDTMHGLNMYDYGARQQDPAVGMFTSMDPLCEKYYNISPYMYCAGNPIRYVDPDGRWINIVIGAVVGGAVDYIGQVTANCIDNGGLSLNCFTDNIDVGSILLSVGAGALTSGSSAIGSAIGEKVISATGSKIAGKVVGGVAKEATEVAAATIGVSEPKEVAANYVVGKVCQFTSKPHISQSSGRKAVRNANYKAQTNGKQLSIKQKDAIRKQTKDSMKNMVKKNAKIDRDNTAQWKFSGGKHKS